MRSLERLLIALFVFLASVQTLPLDLVQYSVLMQVFDDLSCKNCMRFASSDECDGPEVVCKGGFVLHLNLTNMQLFGSIPSSLGQLTGLTYLNFGINRLFGSLPTALGLLTGLSSLSLTQNQLNSTIPSELGQLVALEGLDLSFNSFTGTIFKELTLLTKLISLYLDNNLLVGAVPNVQAPFGDRTCRLQLAQRHQLPSCKCTARTCIPVVSPSTPSTTTATRQTTTATTTIQTLESTPIATSSDLQSAPSSATNTSTTTISEQRPLADNNALIGGIVGGVIALLCIIGVVGGVVVRRRGGKVATSTVPATTTDSRMQSQSDIHKNQYDIIPTGNQYSSAFVDRTVHYDHGRIENQM